MEALEILDDDDELSLLETLDHVLDRGLVIAGEVTIAVADIDLIYLGLNLLLGSVESVNRALGTRERRVELLGARRVDATLESDTTREGKAADEVASDSSDSVAEG